MEYKPSLIGFHNPYKYKGWTPTEFLTAYVHRLKSMGKKKNGWKRIRLATWIEDNWDNQLKFVYRLFPNTLTTAKGATQSGPVKPD